MSFVRSTLTPLRARGDSRCRGSPSRRGRGASATVAKDHRQRDQQQRQRVASRLQNSRACGVRPSDLDRRTGRLMPEPPPSGDDLRRRQTKHLRHDPGADGEIGAAQPEQQRRDRHGKSAAPRPISGNALERRHAGLRGQREQSIAAEPDIGLLADRDEPGVAREEVPQCASAISATNKKRSFSAERAARQARRSEAPDQGAITATCDGSRVQRRLETRGDRLVAKIGRRR